LAVQGSEPAVDHLGVTRDTPPPHSDNPGRSELAPNDEQWRLVIHGPPGERPVASVFPRDAKRTDLAAFQFLLAADQRLPRLPKGALVAAHGRVAAGERPTFVAGDVEIQPASNLRRGDRMLVEAGEVVAHPAVVGVHPGWRYVASHSFDRVDDWDRFVRRDVRKAVAGLVATIGLLLVFVALVARALLTDGSGPLVFAGGGGRIGALGVVASAALALGARRALRDARARRDSPAETMFMELWWSAGRGHGPIAIASLGPALNDHDAIRVAVVGVTEDLLSLDAVVPVVVRGGTTVAPVIEVRGHVLWPAEPARHRTRDGWQRVTRRAAVRGPA
jgi:hypothetical protein